MIADVETQSAARNRRRRGLDGPARLLLSLALALLGHGLYLGLILLAAWVQGEVKPLPPRPRAVSMRPISADQWASNRGAKSSARANRKTPPQKQDPQKVKPAPVEEPPETKPQGQVVEVAPGNAQEDPNAQYLAESSNRVKKETRARETTAFYKNPAPATSAGPTGGQREASATSGNRGLGADEAPVTAAAQKPAFEIPDAKRRAEIAMRTAPSERSAVAANRSQSSEVQGNSDRLRIQEGTEGAGESSSSGQRGEPGQMNLMPSSSVLERIVGAAPNDRLSDVEEGEGTFLNTREWKYASFFNRVKQSVGMHWNPGQQMMKRDPTGSTYAGRDRHTLLSITLDRSGRVRDIAVEKSSGLDFLDLEAIASFQRAQPFPNPPPGLVSGDSTVKFSFGFYMEMGGGPRMRLFRESN